MKRLLITAFSALLFFVSCKKGNDAPEENKPQPQLKTDSTSLNLSGNAGSLDSFTIQSNSGWTLTVSPGAASWLKPSATSGTGDTKIYINIQENNTTRNDRTAALIVTANGTALNPISIAVTQKPYNTAINKIWSKFYGGAEIEHFSFVLPTQDGGFICVGSSNSIDGDVKTPIGQRDIWVVKIDVNGELVWEQSYGGLYDENGAAITKTADGNFVIAASTRSIDGDFSSNRGQDDLFIFKIDPNGNKLWQRILGGSDVESTINFNSITSSVDGGCVIAASTFSNDGDVSGNHGYEDIWVVKLDQNGTVSWKRTFGGTSTDEAHAIISSPDGGFVIAGHTASNDGDVIGNQHPGTYDGWLVKIDASGNEVWQTTVGGSNMDYADAITTTHDNGYIVTGRTGSSDGDANGNHGLSDAWVIKLDANGNKVWLKTYGGLDNDYGYSIVKADAGYIVAGLTWSIDGDLISNPIGVGGWIFKIDEGGEIKWQKNFAGVGYFTLPLSDGSFVVSGVYGGNAGDPIGHHGKSDALIFKFKN